mmetsp:Transcript_11149/g.20161  ORF Transcript_11149/g.20161 Transcript_11149/m.20161 type:complete len:237 (-) Transcript_11149:332-1042(-)
MVVSLKESGINCRSTLNRQIHSNSKLYQLLKNTQVSEAFLQNGDVKDKELNEGCNLESSLDSGAPYISSSPQRISYKKSETPTKILPIHTSSKPSLSTEQVSSQIYKLHDLRKQSLDLLDKREYDATKTSSEYCSWDAVTVRQISNAFEKELIYPLKDRDGTELCRVHLADLRDAASQGYTSRTIRSICDFGLIGMTTDSKVLGSGAVSTKDTKVLDAIERLKVLQRKGRNIITLL